MDNTRVTNSSERLQNIGLTKQVVSLPLAALSGVGVALALGAFSFIGPILAPAIAGTGLIVLIAGISIATLFSLVALAFLISGTKDRISSKTDKNEDFSNSTIHSNKIEINTLYSPIDILDESEDILPIQKIHNSLSNAVSNPQRNACRSVMVHFHTIFSEGSSKIILGNDRTREILLESESSNKIIEDKYDLSDWGMNDMTQQMEQEVRQVDKIDLLISFNGQVDGNQITPHPLLELEGLTHIQHPISEVDEAYEAALSDDQLNPIFEAIDTALEKGETVFLHCNQGEHRSAAILVLYIASRANCSFEEAHAFVNAKREIKSYNSGRTTLMTVAYQKWLNKHSPD